MNKSIQDLRGAKGARHDFDLQIRQNQKIQAGKSDISVQQFHLNLDFPTGGKISTFRLFFPLLGIQPYRLFLDYGPKAQKLGYDLSDMMAMVLFRRWKVLICGNPSADCLIIYQNCQSHLLRTWFLSQNWKVLIMVQQEVKMLNPRK